MASKFGVAGGIPERRVRPIWDAVASRQLKNALKLSTALLSKYPKSPYALALKALILERMGKNEEALTISLTAKEILCTSDSIVFLDDLTLSTLQIVFQRLDHFIAIKMYKAAGEERFLLWTVCSIQLQVCCGSGGEKLLQLAEGLLKKHIASHGLHDPEALSVYVFLLEQQCKYSDALEILSGNLGSLMLIEGDKLRLQCLSTLRRRRVPQHSPPPPSASALSAAAQCLPQPSLPPSASALAAPVRDGDDLTWGDVARASGVNEPLYNLRKSQDSRANKGENGKGSTSKSKGKGKMQLIDEGDFHFDEENEEEKMPKPTKLGRLLAKAGDYAAAADLFQKVLELCPDDWECFLQYIACLLEDSSIFIKDTDPINTMKYLECRNLHISEELFDSRMSDAVNFIRELMGEGNNNSERCLYWAHLEIERLKILFGKGDSDNVVEYLMQYFVRFGHLANYT
ncbi:hypothetical protein OROGR_027754 [Orobanche gracilis]